jgi:hypothetical protein
MALMPLRGWGGDVTPRILHFLLIPVLALAVTACATQPPRPAMVPLGSSGDFGYSQRDLGPDRIEVGYRGAAVPVSAAVPRDDPRSRAELDLARDLALWRAAQIAAERGKAGLKIELENHDSDVEVQQRNYYRPSPFYDPFFEPYDDPFWPGYRRPFDHGFGPQYRFEQVRTATTRAIVTLTVALFQRFDPKVAGMLPASDILARMKATRSGAVY